MDIFVVWQ